MVSPDEFMPENGYKARGIERLSPMFNIERKGLLCQDFYEDGRV